jgi:hypothetical protein
MLHKRRFVRGDFFAINNTVYIDSII